MRTKEQKREHARKHTLLRRLCYKLIRDEVPDVWEKLRLQAGLKPVKKRHP